MSMLSENYQPIIIAVIYFIGGTYAVLTGILALANRDTKIPGFYQFGNFLANLLYRKQKISRLEKEMANRKKAVRSGMLTILIGLILIACGIFLLLD